MANTGSAAKILQINLHHARAASAMAECCFSRGEANLALIQEPWVNCSTIQGLNAAGRILSYPNGVNPRACIVFGKDINYLPVTELLTNDLVAAYINLKGWNGTRVIICSAYLPGEKNDPTEELAKVADYARKQKAELLIGCDANAHHTAWGSTDINERGEKLNDFLLINRLELLNKGREPTFVTRARQEVLDITFATKNLARHITNWHVRNDTSMSDHRQISFELLTTIASRPTIFRNPRHTNWENYRENLKRNLEMIPKTIKTQESLDLAVTAITMGITNAFEDSCPLKTRTSNSKIPWWNPKLSKLRQTTRKLFNKAKRTLQWEDYKTALTEYNKEIRKAKRTSWKSFCQEIDNTTQGARVHKILAKAKPNEIGQLKKPNGSYTESEKETMEVLISTHFPGALQSGNIMPAPHRPKNEDWNRAAKIIRPNQVKWAIGTFKPYKSSGDDGITPVFLQQGLEILTPLLVKIFRASYAWGHIPEEWTKVKILVTLSVFHQQSP